jgi:predicted MFS family arabinose efflux permease
VAVIIVGFCCFLTLYAPQPLLPLFVTEFRASEADVSLIVSMAALAVAFTAPFTGAIADVLGRKRVIVIGMFALAIPTLFIAWAPDLTSFVAWRFIQGLLLPPVFAVTIAYVGEELSPVEATIVSGLYISAASFGGFFERFFAGVAADHVGWRIGFEAIVAMIVLSEMLVALLLPRERQFVRATNLRTSLRQMLRHMRNWQLVSAYVVGFGVLFNFIGVFTYVSFRLVAEPFNMSSTGLGALFTVYLAGVFVSPLVGRWAARFGRRRLALVVGFFYAGGMLLTLSASLPVIVLGLTVFAGGGFVFQSLGTAYVTVMAQEGRSAAVGLYVTGYYLGGGVGGILPGIAWTFTGWPGVVTLCVASAAALTLIAQFWQDEVSRPQISKQERG